MAAFSPGLLGSALALSALVASGGCFDPKPVEGLLCSPDKSCPPGQSCVSADPDGDGFPDDYCFAEDRCIGGECDGGGSEIPQLTFSEAQTHTLGTDVSDLVLRDYNRDNRPDIIVSGGIGGIHLLDNVGGTFDQRIASIFPGDRSFALDVIDMDKDTHPDVPFLHIDSGVLQASIVANNQGGPGAFTHIGPTPLSQEPGGYRGVVGLNVTGHDKPSLLMWGFDTPAELIHQDDATPPFSQATEIFELPGPLQEVFLADVDRDGSDDIVAVGIDQVAVRLQSSPGLYDTAVNYFGREITHLVPIDLNGDDRIDFLASGPNGMQTILHSSVDNIYEDPIDFMDTGLALAYFAAADFDGNGTIDVVNQGGQIFFGDPNAPGTFLSGPLFAGELLNNPLELAAADLNQDGKPDIVVLDGGNGGQDGFVRVYLQE